MHIIVVGAGTTGWSAAACLSVIKNISITIIEPKDIPIIGVGESTIPHINEFHMKCDLPFNSKEWVDKVNGTLKFGIDFNSFYEKDVSWFHPFFSTRDLAKDYEEFDKFAIKNPEKDEFSFVMKHISHGKKIYKGYIPCDDEFVAYKDGAYHLDASKYAEVLKEECLKRDNVHLNDSSVKDIILDDNEYVKHIVMNTGKILSGDLYIDCTGFRAIFGNKIKTEWTSFSDRLLVDTAIAVQLPHINKEKQLHNYTYCHGMAAGWSWQIPLQNRNGFGYNFSSRHISEEEAKEEFKEHLNDFYDYNKNDIEFRTIKYQTGVRKESWKNNVLCLGLSSFFVEPIEATGIATTHNMILQLRSLLMASHITLENKIKRYNQLLEDSMQCILEYIEMHYSLTKREDTEFWKFYKNKRNSEVQQNLLDIHTQSKLSENVLKRILPMSNIFGHTAWIFQFVGAELKKSYK
jgi:tryptophan 7-halogenase